MMVLRNATTDSPWPLTNNPAAKYNDGTRPGCNLKLPLWQLVRASTAAPTYFPPEVIHVDHDFVFVHGGVTMYNNLAFQHFLMVTSEPYHLLWPTGEEKILLVSVGTGACANANSNLSPEEMNLIYNAGTIRSALIAAALHEQDFVCRIFGKCLAGDLLDREIGTVIGQGIPNVPKLFTYAATIRSFPAKAWMRLALNTSIRFTSNKWILSIISAKCKRLAKRWLSKK